MSQHVNDDLEQEEPHLVAPDGNEIKGTVEYLGLSWSGILGLERDANGRLDVTYDEIGTRTRPEVDDVSIGRDQIVIDEKGRYWSENQLVLSDDLPPEDQCPDPISLPTYSEFLAERENVRRTLLMANRAMTELDPVNGLQAARTLIAGLLGEPVDRAHVASIRQQLDQRDRIDQVIGGQGNAPMPGPGQG